MIHIKPSSQTGETEKSNNSIKGKKKKNLKDTFVPPWCLLFVTFIARKLKVNKCVEALQEYHMIPSQICTVTSGKSYLYKRKLTHLGDIVSLRMPCSNPDNSNRIAFGMHLMQLPLYTNLI